MSFSFSDKRFEETVLFVEKTASEFISEYEGNEEVKKSIIFNTAIQVMQLSPFLLGQIPLSTLDDYCTISREWSYLDLNTNLEIFIKKSDLNPTEKITVIEKSFAILFVYFNELSSKRPDLNRNKIRSALNFGIEIYMNVDSEIKGYLNFALFELPNELIKRSFSESEEKIRELTLLSKNLEKSSEKINSWDATLQERETKVEELRTTLIKYETAFNFVGLYNGFQKMHKAKLWQKLFTQVSLTLFGLSIISLIAIEFYFLNKPYLQEMSTSAPTASNTASPAKPNLPQPTPLQANTTPIDQPPKTAQIVAIVIPSFTLLFILLYFFRITLGTLNSVRSQLLQLDLRMTLCQFIQSYSESSKELKEKNKEGFEKFESIIFSSIVASDDKVPSTFDGVEQITKAFNILKGKEAE